MQSPFFAGFDWIGLRAGRHVAPFVPPEAAVVRTVPLTSDEHMLLRTPTYIAHERAKLPPKQSKTSANYLTSTKASRLGKAGVYTNMKNLPDKTETEPESVEPEPPNPLIYQGTPSIFENF